MHLFGKYLYFLYIFYKQFENLRLGLCCQPTSSKKRASKTRKSNFLYFENFHLGTLGFGSLPQKGTNFYLSLTNDFAKSFLKTCNAFIENQGTREGLDLDLRK